MSVCYMLALHLFQFQFHNCDNVTLYLYSFFMASLNVGIHNRYGLIGSE